MKAIVTVTGKDSKGIIAGVCSLLAVNDINILDISQTVMHEYFTMTMLIDLEDCGIDIASLSDLLDELGRKMHLVIRVQREEIFDLMYRV